MQPRADTDRVLDRDRATRDVPCQLRCSQPRLRQVAAAVQRHFMAAVKHPLQQLGAPDNLLTDDEEGRAGAALREELKYRGRALGVRPVVEGERHRAGGARRFKR